MNAVGDAARRAEGRLDDRRKRRVERRNARVGRRIGVDKPGRSRRGMATRLDDFADRRDQRQGRGIATRLDDFADRRDERQGVAPRQRRGAGSPPAAARRRRTEELVDEPAPQTARERRRSASVDRVNGQPTAAKKPATVPAVEQQRPAKKAVAKKRAVKKVPAKKAAAKKAPAKKAPAKKAVARPAKKVAAKKAATRRPTTPEAQANLNLDDLNTQDQRWVLDRLDRRFGDDANLERRIADPNADLRVDIANNDRLIERQQQMANDANLDNRARVLAAEKIERLEARNRRLRNALEDNEPAQRPAKKVAAKKRAVKKTVASRNVNEQRPRRLAKVENDLKEWVDGVADDRERQEVIAGFEKKKQELLRLAAAVPSENVSALEEEYALYDAAIRRLRERNLPPPPRFDPDANANQRRVEGDGRVPNLMDLNVEDRNWVQGQIEAVYMGGAERERANNGIVEEESIDNLEARIRRIEEVEIPSLRKKAQDEDLPKRDRAFYAEGIAIEKERIAAYKAGIERKRELAPAANAAQGGLTPEQISELEKDMAKRYAGLRKKRGAIVGKWMIKAYGNENPPPWKTDKNLKVDELRRLAASGNTEDKAKINAWIKQVYEIDEVVGRNGIRFRTKVTDTSITTGEGRVNGKVEAFNTATQQWEQVGKFTRNIKWTNVNAQNDAEVYNAYLMLGPDAGFASPFARTIKNEGFTSVFNPHAFTWLKASGFKSAGVSAAADGRFVWGRFGFRQRLGERGGENLASNLMGEVAKYRRGERDGLIRTDLDANLIEYLTTVARQKNFSIDAPQHPEYILALAGDANFTEAEKKAYDQKLQAWFVRVSPFNSGTYAFNDQNVPDDPRKLV